MRNRTQSPGCSLKISPYNHTASSRRLSIFKESRERPNIKSTGRIDDRPNCTCEVVQQFLKGFLMSFPPNKRLWRRYWSVLWFYAPLWPHCQVLFAITERVGALFVKNFGCTAVYNTSEGPCFSRVELPQPLLDLIGNQKQKLFVFGVSFIRWARRC